MVEVNESETSVCVRDNEKPHKSIECAFDRVFAHDSTQEDVFLGLVPALDTVVKGFNACVLAYGQTGSGKTHTLIGTRTIGHPLDYAVCSGVRGDNHLHIACLCMRTLAWCIIRTHLR